MASKVRAARGHAAPASAAATHPPPAASLSSSSSSSSSSAAGAAAADLVKLKAITRHLASDYMQGLQGLSGMYDLGTPGEYSTSSILRMLDHVRVHCGVTAESLFCDIGSGLGRPVFAAVLSGAFPRAVGVEIVAEQVAAARATAAKFGLAPPAVDFVHADATKHGLPPDADVVYMFSQGFAPGLLAGVAARMNAHRRWRFLVSATKPAKWADAGLRFHDGDDGSGSGTVTLHNMQMVGSARKYALYVLVRHPPRLPPLAGAGRKAKKPAAAEPAAAAASSSSAAAAAAAASSSSSAAAAAHAPAAGRKRPHGGGSTVASSSSSSAAAAAQAPPARKARTTK
jgi:hypothetical protein